MQTIKDKLLDVRNHCVRYGTIVEDRKWEIRGQHYRKTVFRIGNDVVDITMCNGEVERLNYY